LPVSDTKFAGVVERIAGVREQIAGVVERIAGVTPEAVAGVGLHSGRDCRCHTGSRCRCRNRMNAVSVPWMAGRGPSMGAINGHVARRGKLRDSVPNTPLREAAILGNGDLRRPRDAVIAGPVREADKDRLLGHCSRSCRPRQREDFKAH
jgi:hypothetical protein